MAPTLALTEGACGFSPTNKAPKWRGALALGLSLELRNRPCQQSEGGPQETRIYVAFTGCGKVHFRRAL
jgi:hypothetical protein